jgi:hypothetical protein
MLDPPAYPFDADMARRAIAAQDFIDQHYLRDALNAELRATMPNCQDRYVCWGDDALYAADLASRLSPEFGAREQLEALAREHVAGSRRLFMLKAMEQVIADYKADQSQPSENFNEVQDEPDPPPPPADWKPSYSGPEQSGQNDHIAPPAPIQIKSAEDVPLCVKAAQARKGRK